MTTDDYNAFCGGLPRTTHVVQWGGADVWKIGGVTAPVIAYGSTREPSPRARAART